MQLSGFVLDPNTYPLPGASVVVEGLGVGTVTDSNGHFYFNNAAITGASWILISYVGYITARVSADYINRLNSTGDDAAIQLKQADPVTMQPVIVTTTTPKPQTAGFSWLWWVLGGIAAYKIFKK